MLRNTKDLAGYAVEATDGTIGQVEDFYFDDQKWVVRYLVVDAGSWLSRRKVLISPISFGQPDWPQEKLSVSLTKEQVKNSPDIDTDKPVSRQHEMSFFGYYGYPYYWGGGGLWGGGLYPNMMLPGYGGFGSLNATALEEGNAYARTEAARAEGARHEDDDPHLRSGKAVEGHHIHASDGEIGHVQGLLVDDETWSVRYLVVDTSNWWGGHEVLVAPQWIVGIDWHEETVAVNLTRQAVKDAPPYDSKAPLDRQQEIATYQHYGRPGYWTGDAKGAADMSRVQTRRTP